VRERVVFLVWRGVQIGLVIGAILLVSVLMLDVVIDALVGPAARSVWTTWLRHTQ
jgi:hypothetical protein